MKCHTLMLLVAVVVLSSCAQAAVPGVAEAIDVKVTEGKVIELPGPVSTARHPSPSDPQRRDRSSAGAHAMMQGRRDIPDGVFQQCRAQWLTTKHPDVDLATFAAKARQRYDELIMKHTPSPKLTRVDVEPMTLVYPANYAGNKDAITVHARRLTIHAIDRFGDDRYIVAYYLNYDKVDPDHRTVIMQVNGHFGRNPSQMLVGLKDRGGISGSAVGQIAMRGHAIMVYDDHNVGESSGATGKENGQYRTLANLRMMDDALLVHFDRVDVIGLSGGTERLYHFMMFNRCRIGSAYLSGFAVSPWTQLDSKGRTGGPFGVNGDTFNETFAQNFQWADFVLVGIADGVDVCLAQQTFEGGSGKNCFEHEVLPAVRQYTNDFVIGGDDPNGDGVSDTGADLAHEYDLPDFLQFIKTSRAKRTSSAK